MFIEVSGLRRRICKRISDISDADMRVYINALVSLLIDKISRDIPIIIDNFGTISRKVGTERRAYNVNKREWNIIKPTYIALIPNIAYLNYINYPDNRKHLKLKIIDKSKRLLIDNKKRRKRLQMA